MRSTERDRSTERCVATERCDANDRRSNDRSTAEGRARDGRPPARGAPTGGFYFYDGRTVGRTARERFENVILSDRSKPFARVGIYIRLMYGMYARTTRDCCDAFISTLKNPKP